MSRVLLVSPSFHGYSASIAGALERRGHEVAICHYDTSSSGLGRAWTRVSIELPGKLGIAPEPSKAQLATQRALSALEGSSPDLVLVVKGDRLLPAFHDALDGAGGRPRIQRVLWLYDEVRRTRHTHDSLARYDGIASYSPADVATLAADSLPSIHVPLAYDPTFDPAPRARSVESVLIGARYPAREQLVAHLHAAGIPLRTYGRDWSRHPYDRVRTMSWDRTDVPSEREVPRREAYGIMAAAASTLNIHGDQDGFTMRTFEACGVGGVQLIDRDDVADLYEPGVELAVFHDADELVELAHRAVVDRGWADGLRAAGRKRTLAEHTFDHRIAHLEALWD